MLTRFLIALVVLIVVFVVLSLINFDYPTLAAVAAGIVAFIVAPHAKL